MNKRRWKKFLSYYRPYGRRFATVLLCAVISAAAAVLFPLCVNRVTDLALAGQATTGQIVQMGGLMLLLTAVGWIATFYYDYIGHSVGAHMENDLRQELFAHLEKLPFSFYDNHRVGELMSSLTNDLNDLAELYHHGPEDYLISGVKFIGASFILFALDWKLALCIYIFLPVMGVLTLKLNRKVRKASEDNQRNIAKINAHAEDALSGIRVSQSFNRQDEEKRRFAQAGQRFVRSRKDIYLAESVEYQTLDGLTRLMNVLLIVVGFAGIHMGTVSVANLVTFLLYISLLTDPVKHLAWMTTQFQRGLAGFERVAALLEIQPDIGDKAGAQPLVLRGGEIELEDVTFSYSEGLDTVLDGVNMRVRSGECLAIVGASGVGKTTICALIPRFYDAVQGSVRIDGMDVRDVTLESLRNAISLVPQDTYLFAGTVMENIRYGCPDADDEAVRAAVRNASAEEFIQALPQGYDTDIGPRGVRLSGGQRQRLAIARAFLKDAPVLILDEASSALDSESERYIHEAIARLRKGRTIVLIAHRLSTIRQADRICVLKDGKIVEDGDCESLLMSGGEFARLYAQAENG